MATAQLSHSITIRKASKETVFPSQITNGHESLKIVKKLFAISISCIAYLRGLFPESSYGERHLDGFKVVLMLWKRDTCSSSTSFESGTNNKDIKKASVLLIRKLYILMQDLEPLPNNAVLTMKLHYYNAVTPHDYHPPGFKEGVDSQFLLFDKEPINLQVGFVSTGFHSMKVKVVTEATKVTDLENNLFQENSTTEITHQGLDCDEEEECNDHVRQSFSDFLLCQLNTIDIFQFLPRACLHMECASYKN
ncbi:HORMA domain-containing protein 2 isoform X6 [Aotus nancymaae]|uniref:HORMA domain-containing protein 2 isoform X6 n=1 Tax=Aotus nancymaae TaxID=37293 RepID=UPI0030FE729A